MSARTGQVTDEYNRPVPGATIYVYNGDKSAASVYSDAGLTILLEQPLPVDAFGNYSYYAKSAVYREDTWFGGKLRYREVVAVGIGGAPSITVTAAAGNDVSSRTLLAGIGVPANLQKATLTEPGREGTFVFSTANLSTQVTADPQQGVYVAPSSDTTGASGAWVRTDHAEGIDPYWCGATGLGLVDDGAAWTAALALAVTLGVPLTPKDGTYLLNGTRHGTNKVLIPVPDGASVSIRGSGYGCHLKIANGFTTAADYTFIGHAEAGQSCGTIEISGIRFDGNAANNLVLDSTTHVRGAYPIKLLRGTTAKLSNLYFNDNPSRNLIILGDNGVTRGWDYVELDSITSRNVAGAISGNENQNDHSSFYVQARKAIVRGIDLANDNTAFNPFATPTRSVNALEMHVADLIVDDVRVSNYGDAGIAGAVLYPVEKQLWSNFQFLGMKSNIFVPFCMNGNTVGDIRFVSGVFQIDNVSSGSLGGTCFFQNTDSSMTSTIGSIEFDNCTFEGMSTTPLNIVSHGIQITAASRVRVRPNCMFKNIQGNGVQLINHPTAGLNIGDYDIRGEYYNCGIGTPQTAVYAILVKNTSTNTRFHRGTIAPSLIWADYPAVGSAAPFCRGVNITGGGYIDKLDIHAFDSRGIRRDQRVTFTTTTNNRSVQTIPRRLSYARASVPIAGFFDPGKEVIDASDPAGGYYATRVPATGGSFTEAAWSAGATVIAGQWLTTSTGKVLIVVTGGVTGATEPAPTTLLTTLTDGTATLFYADSVTLTSASLIGAAAAPLTGAASTVATATAAGALYTKAITVTGAVAGDRARVSTGGDLGSAFVPLDPVVGSNIVTARWVNITAASATPNVVTVTAEVMKA